MGRHSVSLLAFCFGFGFLFGIAMLVNVAYLGEVAESASKSTVVEKVKYSSATERLETYQCRMLESKLILMGGIDDNYSPEGDEARDIPEIMEEFFAVAGHRQFKGYDDPAENHIFVEAFDIPSRTYHGIVATRMRDLSNIQNDGLSLVIPYPEKSLLRFPEFVTKSSVSQPDKHGWNVSKDYIWASLDQLKINIHEDSKLLEGKGPENLLDAIRVSQDRTVYLQIGDDTEVDFIGLALCLEPAQKMGAVFSNKHPADQEFGKNFQENEVYLTHGLVDGKVCRGGCVPCEEELPMICIKDENLPIPATFNPDYKGIWTGGHIKFTPAVAGNAFETEDDVDAFCETQFGQGWRHVNGKDGSWTHAMVGYGQAPKEYEHFWVGYKNGPHHICWKQRKSYSDLLEEEAHDE